MAWTALLFSSRSKTSWPFRCRRDPSLGHLTGPPLADILVDRAVDVYGWTVGQSRLGVGLLESTTTDETSPSPPP